MDNAIVLSSGPDVFTNFVPVVLVDIDGFQKRQRLPIRPVPCQIRCCLIPQRWRFSTRSTRDEQLRSDYHGGGEGEKVDYYRLTYWSNFKPKLEDASASAFLGHPLSISRSIFAAEVWGTFGGFTGWRPDGVSVKIWKWEAGGGPMAEMADGRQSRSTCKQASIRKHISSGIFRRCRLSTHRLKYIDLAQIACECKVSTA